MTGHAAGEHPHIWAAFAATAGRRPEHPAVVYLGTTFSYRRVRELAEAFAAGLNETGVAPGDRVVLYVPNGIQWVVAWLGILRAGAVAVPITPVYTPEDVAGIASDAGAETIVCSDTNYGYVVRAMGASPLRRVVVAGMTDLLPLGKRLFGFLFDVVPTGRVERAAHVIPLRRLLARGAGRSAPPLATAPADVAEQLYTGGTTKRPKGVPISHELFLISAWPQVLASAPLIPPDENVMLANAPMFHILGQMCGLGVLLVGGTLLLQPRVNLDATFSIVERHRARSMVGVPQLYRMILEHDRVERYDLSSVDFWLTGGDVLPLEVANRWRARFGKPIYQGYGTTECCGGVTMCPVQRENPPRTVGLPLEIKQVRIADPETLAPVPPGTPGELLVSSDPMVTAYHERPEETAEAFVQQDGRTWYRTGDMMSMDEAGYLYFVDRSVDSIKHKGYRVSASEVEAVLQEHPAVMAACVVGIADALVGERIKAFVVLKADVRGMTGQDLIRWCRQSLPAYKLPQYVEFRDMLPKSKVGKLLRREMRDQERRRAEG